MPNSNVFDEHFIKTFYETVVLGADNSPALKSFWFVEFEIPALLLGIYSDFKTKSANFMSDPELWSINSSYSFNVKNAPRARYLIQGVNVPGDGMESEYTSSPVNSGYIKGRTGLGRKNFEQITISFLENNASIIDFLIRPWVSMVSYSSLKNPNIKTNLQITQLQKGEKGFKIRKVYNFIKAVPISVDNEDYTYETPNSIITRVSNWVYNYYTVEDRKSDMEWSSFTYKNRIPKEETFLLPEQQLFEPTWATVSSNVLTDLKNTAENVAHRAAGELTGTFGGITGKVVDAVAGGNLVGDLIGGRLGLHNLQIPLISDTPSPVEVYAKSQLTDIAANAIGSLLGNESQNSDVPVPLTSKDISIEGNSVINSVNAKDIKVASSDVVNSLRTYDKKIQNDSPVPLRSSDAANPGNDTSKIMAVADIKTPSGDTSINWDIKGKIINTKDVPVYDEVVNLAPVGNINADTATHYGSTDSKPNNPPFSDNPSPLFSVPEKQISTEDSPTNLSKINDKQININQLDVVKGNIIKGIIINNQEDVVVKK